MQEHLVKKVALKDVVKIKRGQRIRKEDLIADGQYVVISGGSKPFGYYDQFNQAGQIVTIAQYGTAGYISWQEQPFWANDVCYCLIPNEELDGRFLYHYLKNQQLTIDELVNAKAIPAHLPQEKLELLEIYVPDLKIQKQIAATLDQFNQLTNQLTNQLNLQNKQYQYYLEHLMDFANDNHPLIKDGGGVIRKIPLGDLFRIKIGDNVLGKFLAKSANAQYQFPVISGGKQPLGYWKTFSHQGQTITISKNGTAGYVSWQEQPFYLNNVAMALINHKPDQVLDRYLYYFLKAHQEQIYEMTKHAIPPCLRKSELQQLIIDLPDLAIQKQIVNALDQLNAITSDLTIGLPAAIKQAQKQYQYYLATLMKF